MKNLLEVQDLNLTYHTKEFETVALKDLNFSLKPTEFISLVGPSGCGKTTILSLIAGLLKASSGQILYCDKPIEGINKDIGYMFQQDNLFDWLTVEQNVLFGLKIQKKLTEETKANALSLVEKYGLKEFSTHYPNELSGGMRQRVSLIRTLATSPKLLLLDEPFSALDYQTRLNIQDTVHKIIKTEKKSAILVTHDISEAVVLSDRILILTKRPAEVKTNLTLNFSPDLTPFGRRDSPLFNSYFASIWEDLKTWKKTLPNTNYT